MRSSPARDRLWRALLARIQDVDDIDDAVAACGELDRAADDTWIPRLGRLLREGRDFFVREAAAVPLARLEGTRALPRLLEALARGAAEGHDNDGLGAVIVGVVQGDRPGAVPLVRPLLGSRRARERADGAWLWGFLAELVEADPLLRLVRDRSPRVRAAAAGALASFMDRESVLEAVVGAATDRAPEVRTSAALALSRSGASAARAALEGLAGDPDRNVAQYAAAVAARRPG